MIHEWKVWGKKVWFVWQISFFYSTLWVCRFCTELSKSRAPVESLPSCLACFPQSAFRYAFKNMCSVLIKIEKGGKPLPLRFFLLFCWIARKTTNVVFIKKSFDQAHALSEAWMTERWLWMTCAVRKGWDGCVSLRGRKKWNISKQHTAREKGNLLLST